RFFSKLLDEFRLRDDRRGYRDLDGAAFQLVEVYVGRILKCEKVADLPVQQSTKVALTLNLKIAKTLGITFFEALQGVLMKLSSKSAKVPYGHKRPPNVGALSEADYCRDLQARLGPAAGEERRHSPDAPRGVRTCNVGARQ